MTAGDIDLCGSSNIDAQPLRCSSVLGWVLPGLFLMACSAQPDVESPFGSASTPEGTSQGPTDTSDTSDASDASDTSSGVGQTSVMDSSGDPVGEATTDDTTAGDTTGDSTSDTSSTGPGFACVDPPAGLLAWWRGEGNTDDHTMVHDASASAGLAFGSGRVGHALLLDGTDTAMVASNAPLLPLGDFSIEAWVRTSQAEVSVIVSTYECGGTCISMESASQYFLRINDTGVAWIAMRDESGATQNAMGTTIVADGQFHHVIAVRDVTTGTLRLYVDGLVEANDPLIVTGPLQDVDGDTDPVIIGAQYGPANTTPERLFIGEIDELSLYTAALDDQTVLELFEAGEEGKCVL